VINFNRFKAERNGEILIEKLNVKIFGEEKVGIICKSIQSSSELFNAILKTNDQNGKRIEIDGIELNEIGKFDLRKQIHIISSVTISNYTYIKTPYLFKGTLKKNIDIENFYTEVQIKNAIRFPILLKFIQKKTLDFKVSIYI
jgi:ABC-type multidrug transport system fused ATPase/permease subunit